MSQAEQANEIQRVRQEKREARFAQLNTYSLQELQAHARYLLENMVRRNDADAYQRSNQFYGTQEKRDLIEFIIDIELPLLDVGLTPVESAIEPDQVSAGEVFYRGKTIRTALVVAPGRESTVLIKDTYGNTIASLIINTFDDHTSIDVVPKNREVPVVAFALSDGSEILREKLPQGTSLITLLGLSE